MDYEKGQVSWTVYFNDILYDSPADRAAGIDLLLQLKTTFVAETHMSTGVNNRIDLTVKANSALAIFAVRWIGRGEGR